MNHNSNTPKNEDKETRNLYFFLRPGNQTNQEQQTFQHSQQKKKKVPTKHTETFYFNQTNTFGRSKFATSANL